MIKASIFLEIFMEKIDLTSYIEATKDLDIFSIIVLQHGEKVGEYHREAERVRPQYSVTKSFTSTAVGIAVDEGLLSLDDRVLEFFLEDAPIYPSDNLINLKIRDLLKMAVGHSNGYLMADGNFGTTPRGEVLEKNWVKYCLNQHFPYKPGDKFIYNNAAAYLAGVIVQKVSGELLEDYLMPRLFKPLGISKPIWEKCPMGYNFGAGGLELKISDLSKFGQLYLQNGNWKGIQLLSKAWVKDATSKHIETDNSGDWGQGYGYQFWRGEHNSYRADGKYGQYCIVLEKEDAVIAINSHANHVRGILENLWGEVWPQLVRR
ncbi:serine hydrolase [Clostridium sp.]|uniref:serine hydrolase domain-containing protein n=1 Tax=Clostridium sp. TaxID=1506 RepID=UPI0032163859